jgi:hypothetical protein
MTALQGADKIVALVNAFNTETLANLAAYVPAPTPAQVAAFVAEAKADLAALVADVAATRSDIQ